jgi:hypothetical protein
LQLQVQLEMPAHAWEVVRPPVTPSAPHQIDLFYMRQQVDVECPNISHNGGSRA